MKDGRFNVILDCFWGSSGKGKTSAWLADHFSSTNVSSSNFPNAGHTARFDDGLKFIAKALPTAAVLKRARGMGMRCFLSPGSGFDWRQLIREWNECGRPEVRIHSRASVVTEDHKAREQNGHESTKHIASTMQGSATAMTDKILRKKGCVLAGTTKLEELARAYALTDPDAYRILGANGEEGPMFRSLGKGGAEFLESVSVTDPMDFRSIVHNIISSGEPWLHEGSQGYALSIDHGSHYPNCLSGDSRILMDNGSTKKIRKVSVGDVVLSKDDEGRILPKRVMNCWKNPTGGKKWFNVVTETSVYNKHDRQWVGPKLTGDHKVQTKRGKIAVQDLVRGDQVFINESELVEDGLQVFLGSVLGDGTIPNIKKHRRRSTIQISHGSKQKEYAQAKASILRGYVGGRVRTIVYGVGSFKEGNEQTRYESAASISVKRMAARTGRFGSGDPNVKEIMHLIDERGLSIWYQDDGQRKNASNGQEVLLHTCGFSRQCVEELASALEGKFGLHFSVYSKKKQGDPETEYPYLRLARADHEKWFSMIGKYVHPNLEYKLPPGMKGNWSESWTRPGNIQCTTETVLDVVPSRDFRGMSNCYDIEVEGTHNFFVKNDKGAFNVENCTSRNCTLQAAMDQMAITPAMVGDVYLNLRTYPIRVGNVVENGEQVGYSGDFYDDCAELTWEQVAAESGMPADEARQLAERERTTVTKRIRRVSTFSHAGLADAVRTNGATKLVLNFMQYVSWEDNGVKVFDKLSKKSRDFIAKIEDTANLPVVLVGTGASHEEMICREEMM